MQGLRVANPKVLSFTPLQLPKSEMSNLHGF